jgi:flagellar biosynthesis anti-sigma factor FlgM
MSRKINGLGTGRGWASQLAALGETLRAIPAVDEARVCQTRSAIENGTYTVRPEHIADQLMQLERALDSGRP